MADCNGNGNGNGNGDGYGNGNGDAPSLHECVVTLTEQTFRDFEPDGPASCASRPAAS
jgi:hypothetical protein